MSSVSTRNMFERCKYSVYLKGQGHKAEPSQPMIVGVESHKILLEYGKHLIKEQLEKDEYWFKNKLRDLSKLFNEEIKDEIFWSLNKASDMITFDYNYNNMVELSFAMDENLELDDWKEDNFFHGVIDWLSISKDGKKAIITDYKTGMGRQTNVNQLTWYGLAVLLFFEEVEEVETRWLFTRKTAFVDNEIIEGPTLTRKDISLIKKDLTKKIKEVHEAIKEPQEPSLGEACFNCGYRSICKYVREWENQELDKEAKFDPEYLYKQMMIAKGRQEWIAKKLKEAIKDQGALPIGDNQVYTKVPEEKTTLSKDYKKDPFTVLNKVASISEVSVDSLVNLMGITDGQWKKVIKIVENNDDLKECFTTKKTYKYKVIDKEELKED